MNTRSSTLINLKRFELASSRKSSDRLILGAVYSRLSNEKKLDLQKLLNIKNVKKFFNFSKFKKNSFIRLTSSLIRNSYFFWAIIYKFFKKNISNYLHNLVWLTLLKTDDFYIKRDLKQDLISAANNKLVKFNFFFCKNFRLNHRKALKRLKILKRMKRLKRLKRLKNFKKSNKPINKKKPYLNFNEIKTLLKASKMHLTDKKFYWNLLKALSNKKRTFKRTLRAFYNKKFKYIKHKKTLRVTKKLYRKTLNLKKVIAFKKFYKILYGKLFTLKEIVKLINANFSKTMKNSLKDRSTSWFKKSNNKYSSKPKDKRLPWSKVFRSIYKSFKRFKLLKKLKQRKLKKFMFKGIHRRKKWNKKRFFFKKNFFQRINFYYNTKKFVESLPIKYYYKKMLINFRDTGINLNRKRKMKKFQWKPSIRI